MSTRPRIFLALSFVFLMIALSFPFQALVVYGESISDFFQSLRMISFLNILVISALVLNIPLLLRASRLLMVSVPLTVTLVLWNNYVVGSMNMGVSPLLAILSSLAFVSLTGTLLSPIAFKVLSNPTKRWWLQSRRAMVKIPAELKGFRVDAGHLNTFDLSTSGAYLTGFDESEWEQAQEMGKVFDLSIAITPLLKVRCEAKMVRACEGDSGAYPRGIGVQFLGLTRQEQGRIGRHILKEVSESHRASVLA